jgi:YjjG family noncanonical pyrimidine nucleotidase
MGASMKTYRGFLFDADNTLFDYDAAESQALDETCGRWFPDVPKEVARGTYRAINARYWAALESGTVTMSELKVGRFAELLAALRAPGDPGVISASYLALLGGKAILLPRAREVIQELSQRARLCLITNGISSVQRGRLSVSGLADFFNAVLVSEELGLAKPDRRFFEQACAALGLPSSDVLCVGDNPVADVGGAMAAGIDACWFSPGGHEWPGPGAPPLFVARTLLEVVNFASGVFP